MADRRQDLKNGTGSMRRVEIVERLGSKSLERPIVQRGRRDGLMQFHEEARQEERPPSWNQNKTWESSSRETGEGDHGHPALILA